MATIQPKRKAVIKKGSNYSYDPKTFAKEHKYDNFYSTENAEDVFKLIAPFIVDGRKMLVLDTEDYPIDIKNHNIPVDHVRRWVGKGKKATPVDKPFCISICDGINAVTLYDTEENNFNEFRKMNVWLEDPTIEKIFHNTKFDMHMLANIRMYMLGKLHDTVVTSKLTNENRYSFKLRDIAEKRPWGIVEFEYMVDTYKKVHKITDYRLIPRELLDEYANADVWNCYHLFMEDYEKLKEDELFTLYENELELLIGLWLMERVGMKADKEYEVPLKQDLRKLTDDAERSVYEEAGVFNMNSGKQLHQVLLKLGVSPSIIKIKRDTGNPVLDKKELNRLADKHNVSIVKKVLEYRKYEKLLGTYAMGIYDQYDKGYKVHCSINQTEATTGRMSITKPALQTLPKKDKRIRKVFIPSEGYELWFMDLDQIEYRLFAHYAKAIGLIEAIRKGQDVHAATAAIIYGKPIEKVTEEERDRAKTINFSLIYGQGDEASSIALKLTMAETRRFKNHYFAMLPEAFPFINTVQRVIRTRGYVKNFYGRRRRLVSNDAYKGPNALIQGCAADYIKHKLVRITKFLLSHGYKTRCVNIVHDELVIEVHESEKFLVPKLRWLLSDFEAFRVPITAGAEYGTPSWGEKAEPVNEVGFEKPTEEEMKRISEFDIFKGTVYETIA